jgi:hypothetical protein
LQQRLEVQQQRLELVVQQRLAAGAGATQPPLKLPPLKARLAGSEQTIK